MFAFYVPCRKESRMSADVIAANLSSCPWWLDKENDLMSSHAPLPEHALNALNRWCIAQGMRNVSLNGTLAEQTQHGGHDPDVGDYADSVIINDVSGDEILPNTPAIEITGEHNLKLLAKAGVTFPCCGDYAPARWATRN
jgi:hypothetical protein